MRFRFSSSDVEIASGYPMDEDVNTLLLFKLNFPSSKTDQKGNTNLNQASLIGSEFSACFTEWTRCKTGKF